jgi:hypothetical protein
MPGEPVRTLADGFPTRGDHHTNGPAVGPDGALYVGLGTVTNAGIMGEDSAAFGWLLRFPDLHDVPCRDVTLSGRTFRTRDPFAPSAPASVETGAFVPFGHATAPGQVVPGRVPCSGAVLRVSSAGGTPELVAWGLRNPFGLAFAPDGRLLATDNGYDDRGSRRVHGAGDLLWAVVPGRWYGWPDYHGERRLDDGDRFAPPGGLRPLRSWPRHRRARRRPWRCWRPRGGRRPRRLARAGLRSRRPGVRRAVRGPGARRGETLAPVGCKVVRVDLATGVVTDFAVNREPLNGPASRVGGGGLERPIAARFDPAGRALHVVDFGVMTVTRAGTTPHPGTGVLWRIVARS